MLARKYRTRKYIHPNRDIAVECFSCQRTFTAVIPVLSRICPDCQMRLSTRPEHAKFSVVEAFEGRRVYIVKRFIEVAGKAFWQHFHEATGIEEARKAIPDGAQRFSKNLSDPQDVVETWIGWE